MTDITKSIFLFLLLTGSLTGCKNNSVGSSETIETDFTEVCDVSGIGTPTQFLCLDDTIYIIDYHDQKVINRIISSTGENLGRSLGIGNGPGEILPPVRLAITDDSIFVHCMSMQNVMSATRGNLDKLTIKGQLPPASSKLFVLNNNEFVVSLIPFGPFTETGDARYIMLDNSLDQKYSFGKFPAYTTTDRDATPAALAMFHQTLDIWPVTADEFVAVGRYEISFYKKDADGAYDLAKDVMVIPYEYDITLRGDNQTPAVKQRDGFTGVITSSFVSDGKVYVAVSDSADERVTTIKVYDFNGEHVCDIIPTLSLSGYFTPDSNGKILGLLEKENVTKLVRSK